MRMYHRIIFNLWCIYLVIALAVLKNFAPGAKYYVAIIMIIILLVGVLVTRPYRSEATNVIYVLGVMGLLIQMIFIACILEECDSSFFIDRFYLITSSILNGFLWFLIFITLLFVMVARQRWPTTQEVVDDLMMDQDLALYQVKEARKF